MEQISLFIFIAACIGLLLWGMRHPERVFEYPFLMGAIFSAFLIPQALSLVNRPGPVSLESIDRAFFMGTLCMFMVWAGYTPRPLRSVSHGPVRELSNARIALAAFAALAISIAAIAAMPFVPQEEVKSGTGIFTILAFFSGFSIVSFPIFLARMLEKTTIINITLGLVSGAPLYLPLFFSGRRSQGAALIIVVMILVFFYKKILPSRLFVLGAVILVAYLIPVFAAIRQEFWADIFAGSFAAIPFEESMNRILAGDILELRNAAALIQGTLITGEYGYGTGFWDALVFRYVPGQLLGFDLKNSLQFKWTMNANAAIGYIVSTGSTPTGIGDAFQEFGYFGSLFFYFQGFLFKNIWVLASKRKSLIAQVAYVALIPIALLGVTHATAWFIQGVPIVWMLLYAFYLFARLPAQASRTDTKKSFRRISDSEDYCFQGRGQS